MHNPEKLATLVIGHWIHKTQDGDKKYNTED
jgi:hypothetical protein